MTVHSSEPPKPEAPFLAFKKTLQDAFIAGYNNPGQFARDFLDFSPYPGQDDFLLKWLNTKEAVFDAGNRAGKSFIAGVMLLHKAFYRHYSPFYTFERSKYARYTAIVTSLTQGQANIAFEYARQFTTSPRFKGFLDGDIVYSPFPIMRVKTRLANGDPATAEITARSLANRGVNLLGHSFGFMLVDETAFTPNYKEIEDTVLRMRLADQGGSLTKISSPNGRNHFYVDFSQWWHNNEQPDPAYLSYRLTSLDNPYVSREFLKEQKKRMLPDLYRQNVLAEFVTLGDFFGEEAINALYRDSDKHYPSFPIPRTDNGRYVMGVDLGFKRDATVIFVMDVSSSPNKLVYARELQSAPQPLVQAEIVQAYNLYRPSKTAMDATGVGMTFVDDLVREYELENVIQFVFSAPSKLDLMTRLQGAIYRCEFIIPFVQETRTLIEQLGFYKLDDKKIKNDHPIALGLTNLAREDLLRDGVIYSDIAPGMMVTPIFYGGQSIASDLLYGNDDFLPDNGVAFTVDQRTGLFVPMM